MLKTLSGQSHVREYVATVEKRSRRKKNDFYPLTPLNKASTFPLFCSEHDNSLFKQLESPEFGMTLEALNQFTFRELSLRNHLTQRSLLTANDPKVSLFAPDHWLEYWSDLTTQIGEYRRTDNLSYDRARYLSFPENVALNRGFIHFEFEDELPFSFTHTDVPFINQLGINTLATMETPKNLGFVVSLCFNAGGKGNFVIRWRRTDLRAESQMAPLINGDERAKHYLLKCVTDSDNVIMKRSERPKFPDFWVQDDIRQGLFYFQRGDYYEHLLDKYCIEFSPKVKTNFNDSKLDWDKRIVGMNSN